jgi:hypothetical protein
MADLPYTEVIGGSEEVTLPGYATYGICAADGTALSYSASLWRCTKGHAYQVFVVGATQFVAYHAIEDGIATRVVSVRNESVNASRAAVTAGTGTSVRNETVQSTSGYVTVVS